MLLFVDAVEAFQRALKSLKKGELSRISEATGINLSRLSGYKNGRKTDVQISTFAMIAREIGRPADELLGLREPDPSKTFESDVRAARAEAEKAKRQMAKARELLDKGLGPADTKPPKSQP